MPDDRDRKNARRILDFQNRARDFPMWELPGYMDWSGRKLAEGESPALIANLDATSAWLLPEDASKQTEKDYDEMFEDLKYEMDCIYREDGLKQMAPPHIHYHRTNCPHPCCTYKMEWIDFQLELFGDPEGIYKPLVKSWWEGKGFAGRCPGCQGWVLFTTLRMEAISEDQAQALPNLPENWHTVAQFG